MLEKLERSQEYGSVSARIPKLDTSVNQKGKVTSSTSIYPTTMGRLGVISGSMVQLIRDLWNGVVPLKQAFWWYAVVYGFVVNLMTSLLFLALLVSDVSLIPLIFGFLLPVPFNLFVAVAVWRSAKQYQGPSEWADLARAATVIWMLILSMT